MADYLTSQHKKDLSKCVQSILRSTGGSITGASDLQSFFDSLLSATRADNALYAYEWNAHGRDKLSHFPVELLVHCLSYLDLAAWLRATLVSRRWHKLMETPAIWSKVTVKYPHRALTSDHTKVEWLSKYLAKSAQATLDIEWLEYSISQAEIDVLAANMHRTAHFEALRPLRTGIPSWSLTLPVPHLKTFCFSIAPGYEDMKDVFQFENIFGADQLLKLRKVRVGHFTLPADKSLPAVTNFEGILRGEDNSNRRLFTFFPSLTSATLLYQTCPVIPRGPFPTTLHTLRIAPSDSIMLDFSVEYEPLLDAAIHPIRAVSIDHIGTLQVPFELFRRAVSQEWHLTACPVKAGSNNYIFTVSTLFTMGPANNSSADKICHSFSTMDHIWQAFLSSPAGTTSVAQNTLLVSLQLTPSTFSALLKASANLPALRVFTLYVRDVIHLPRRHNMPNSDRNCSPVKAASLRKFVLEFDGASHSSTVLWFTRFLPSHIRDMFEYPRERLEQLAFIGEYPNQVKRSDYAWGLVARLADKVHVGRSLDESPLLVPNEDDDVSEGSDWEIDEDDYLDEEYDEDAGIYDYYDPYDYYDGGYDLDWL